MKEAVGHQGRSSKEDREKGSQNKKRKAIEDDEEGEPDVFGDDDEHLEEEETTMIVNEPKPFDRKLGKLPPPITVDRPSTPKETHALLRHLQEGLQYEAIKQVFLKQISIKCNTMADYDAVCGKLRDREEGWFTYTAKSRRQLRMVMTNAPNLYSDGEYKEFLERKGLCVELFSRMKTAAGYESNSILVGFTPGTKAEDVKKANKMDAITVGWRPFQPSKGRVLQCKKCFELGHATANCGRTQKCRKCGGEHSNDDCKEPESKCSNCGAVGHSATQASKCPKFQAEKERKQGAPRERLTSTNSSQSRSRRGSTSSVFSRGEAPTGNKNRPGKPSTVPGGRPLTKTDPRDGRRAGNAGPASQGDNGDNAGASKDGPAPSQPASTSTPTDISQPGILASNNKKDSRRRPSVSFSGSDWTSVTMPPKNSDDVSEMLSTIQDNPELLHESVSPINLVTLVANLMANLNSNKSRDFQVAAVAAFCRTIFFGHGL